MKSKKIILSLAAISTIVIPASAVLSCSYNDEREMLSKLKLQDINGLLKIFQNLDGPGSLSKKQDIWGAISGFFQDSDTYAINGKEGRTTTIGFNNSTIENHTYDQFIGIYIKIWAPDYQGVPSDEDYDEILGWFNVRIVAIWTAHFKFNTQIDFLKEIPTSDTLFDKPITLTDFQGMPT